MASSLTLNVIIVYVGRWFVASPSVGIVHLSRNVGGKGDSAGMPRDWNLWSTRIKTRKINSDALWETTMTPANYTGMTVGDVGLAGMTDARGRLQLKWEISDYFILFAAWEIILAPLVRRLHNFENGRFPLHLFQSYIDYSYEFDHNHSSSS